MNLSPRGLDQESAEGDKNCLNSELWHACAGPLVSLPSIGSHVVYFPQGHSEQVAVSTNKEVDAQIPNYPSLPPQLICQLHNVTMHADIETDEVYAKMTLQPLSPQEQKEVSFLPADLGGASKQPTNYFCKTLTASDTSTHGGFSVPRRAAEKVFPPLDFSQQPPCQELIARDLHNNEWKFRHIFRGQPKRHLLTTGWSVFVSAKRLVAGDSVLFIWNEKNQMLLGIRRANRPQTVMPSSVLSSDSMHIGLLAAAAHAASTNSRFTIFYNPRTSPSEFIISLAKYIKAVYHTRVSVGMRFRMLFETEESSVRRYMGTITSIGDLDPVRWPNSHWRSVKVGWDESTAGEKQPRVSLWEIEPLTTFPMYPSLFPLRLKRPWPPTLPSYTGMKADDTSSNSPLMWLRGDGMQSPNQGMGIATPWMMQPRLDSSVLDMQNDIYQAMAAAAAMQDQLQAADTSKQILSSMMQFQQPQLIPHQMVQHSRSSTPFLQNQSQMQPQTNLLPQQMLHHNTFSTSQIHHRQQLQPNSMLFQLSSNSEDNTSNLLNLPRSSNLLSSNGWPTKRVALDPLLSGGMSQQTISPHIDDPQLGPSNTNPVSLPPFPSRECLIEQEGNSVPQNHLLFGGNVNSGYMSSSGADYSLNPTLTSSSCMDGSGFLMSSDNEGHANPPNQTFVKIYKSGSFGRSLDMTKFSSYNELRSEIAQMFGLEGQLEDPMRSGWQLLFVDRENDILLLGDDPWEEFVNSVWSIKILSPEEVQEMGKQGSELLVPPQKLPQHNGEENHVVSDFHHTLLWSV